METVSQEAREGPSTVWGLLNYNRTMTRAGRAVSATDIRAYAMLPLKVFGKTLVSKGFEIPDYHAESLWVYVACNQTLQVQCVSKRLRPFDYEGQGCFFAVSSGCYAGPVKHIQPEHIKLVAPYVF